MSFSDELKKRTPVAVIAEHPFGISTASNLIMRGRPVTAVYQFQIEKMTLKINFMSSPIPEASWPRFCESLEELAEDVDFSSIILVESIDPNDEFENSFLQKVKAICSDIQILSPSDVTRLIQAPWKNKQRAILNRNQASANPVAFQSGDGKDIKTPEDLRRAMNGLGIRIPAHKIQHRQMVEDFQDGRGGLKLTDLTLPPWFEGEKPDDELLQAMSFYMDVAMFDNRGNPPLIQNQRGVEYAGIKLAREISFVCDCISEEEAYEYYPVLSPKCIKLVDYWDRKGWIPKKKTEDRGY
ncbi:MAG: hypothetical protein ACTSYI_15755 [Promethearchaeota archaeon]